MKRGLPATRVALATTCLVGLFPVTSAATMATPDASMKQSVRVISISEHCVDEWDEDDTIYINEGDADCRITVQVRGRGKTKSKVALEYYDDEDGWIRTEFAVQTTNVSGKVTFVLETDFPTGVDDDCYEFDSWTHRFAVARTGRFKSFRSSTFEVSYTSLGTNPACSGLE